MLHFPSDAFLPGYLIFMNHRPANNFCDIPAASFAQFAAIVCIRHEIAETKKVPSSFQDKSSVKLTAYAFDSS